MHTRHVIGIPLLLISGMSGLNGCATHKTHPLLPQQGPSMSAIYRSQSDVSFPVNPLDRVRLQVTQGHDETQPLSLHRLSDAHRDDICVSSF